MPASILDHTCLYVCEYKLHLFRRTQYRLIYNMCVICFGSFSGHRPARQYKFNGKGKIHSRGPTRAQRGDRRIALPFLFTSALDEGGWSTPRPGRFIPWKGTRYLLCRRLGGPQGRSGRVRKISSPPGFDPLIVQAVAQAGQYKILQKEDITRYIIMYPWFIVTVFL